MKGLKGLVGSLWQVVVEDYPRREAELWTSFWEGREGEGRERGERVWRREMGRGIQSEMISSKCATMMYAIYDASRLLPYNSSLHL